MTVGVSDVNVGKATAAFTLPDLPAATYHLMLCDAACTRALADVIPATDFTVVADPATAQIAQRADRLARRIRDQARQLSAARTGTRRALIAAWNASAEVAQLEARVSSPARESRSSARVPRWAYAGWFVAGVLVGVLALRVLRRRWSRRAGWVPSDEELQELLSSERDSQGRPARDTRNPAASALPAGRAAGRLERDGRWRP